MVGPFTWCEGGCGQPPLHGVRVAVVGPFTWCEGGCGQPPLHGVRVAVVSPLYMV